MKETGRLLYRVILVMVMTNDNYRQGAKFENKVCGMFEGVGFIAVRAAGSGTTSRTCPDIVAHNGNDTFLIECKTHSGSGINLRPNDKEQLRKMFDVAKKGSLREPSVMRTEILVVTTNVEGGLTMFGVVGPTGKVDSDGYRPLYKLLKRYKE